MARLIMSLAQRSTETMAAGRAWRSLTAVIDLRMLVM
jgi:hypothetical protein